jgi:hypothetical protein
MTLVKRMLKVDEEFFGAGPDAGPDNNCGRFSGTCRFHPRGSSPIPQVRGSRR